MTKTLERIPVPVDPQPVPPRRKPFDLSATQLVGTRAGGHHRDHRRLLPGHRRHRDRRSAGQRADRSGNAVYSQSLRRTHARVRDAVPGARRKSRATAPEPAPAADVSTDTQVPVLPAATSASVDARIWRRVALGSVAVFVAVLAAVTGVELVAGRPVSDLVRGDSGQGTSLFGDQQHQSRTSVPQTPDAPAPT